MAELGKRLVAGDRAPYMPAQGAGLLADAAGGGSVEAMLCLACLLALGAHVPQSWSAAFGWLVGAAELGSESARSQLRYCRGRAAAGSTAEDWRELVRAIDLAGWLSPPPGITLHDAPLVRHFPNFLQPALCDWLIDKARAWLRPAMIYSGGAHDTVDEMRTNSVAVWSLARMDLVNVVRAVSNRGGLPHAPRQSRSADGAALPSRRADHESYRLHQPEIAALSNEIATRGERVITFLGYLNDDYDGGETDFPVMKVRHKGRRGDGLFFCNALPSTAPDDRALHAGLPPTRGEKWMVSQFVRSKAVFNTPAENVA